MRKLLKKYLEKYLIDFDPQELNISLVAGETNIHNVRINPEPIRDLLRKLLCPLWDSCVPNCLLGGVPLELMHGTIKTMNIKWALRKITSRAFVVRVSAISRYCDRVSFSFTCNPGNPGG